MHHHILSLTIHSSFHITRFSALFFLRWIINLFKVIFGFKAIGERLDRDFSHWLLRTMLWCAWCYVRIASFRIFMQKVEKLSELNFEFFSQFFCFYENTKVNGKFIRKRSSRHISKSQPESDGAFIIHLCVMARGRERVKNANNFYFCGKMLKMDAVIWRRCHLDS